MNHLKNRRENGNVMDDYIFITRRIDCAVCLCRCDKERHRPLPCKHTFHPRCIGGWIRRGNNTCPLCRVIFDPYVLLSNPSKAPVICAVECVDLTQE
jgi:hypothetical protein